MCNVTRIIFICCVALLNISYGMDTYCRDDDNKPVDWWYIYKPPVDVVPYRPDSGRDFLYLLPKTVGKWTYSDKRITDNSMLYNTLSPLFRSFTDSLAVVVYGSSKQGGNTLSPMGVLVADQRGGFWIGHTVPGLVDFTKDQPTFPDSEIAYGHLLTCLSLDLLTLNRFAMMIRQTAPRFSRIQIPMALRLQLPTWNFLDGTGWKGFQALQQTKGKSLRDTLEFNTRNKSLSATLLVRKPRGESLYKKFAQKNQLIMDVYGHREPSKQFCLKDYGVRKIESISINVPDYVLYVGKTHDRASFGVSGAAHWQRAGGAGAGHFSACSGADAASGAALLCATHYQLWGSFYNLRVEEPAC